MNKMLRIAVLCLGLLPGGLLAQGSVDINSADAATLAAELDGIGAAKAEAIVAYRTKNGPFKSADDLLQIEGIGDKTLETNRAKITVGKPAP